MAYGYETRWSWPSVSLMPAHGAWVTDKGVTMAKITLSASQCIALREAKITDAQTYTLDSAKGQTLNALRRMGMVMPETRELTVAGAVARMSVVSDPSPISKGRKHVAYDLGDADALFVIPSVVETDNGVMADWERDMEESRELVTPKNVSTPGHPFVGVKMYDGTFRGMCSVGSVSTHMGSVYGDTAESMELCATCENTLDRCANLTNYREQEEREHMEAAPVDVLAESIATMREPYVGVRQGRKGFTAVEHIHAPGCGDIAKELKRFRGDTFDYAASMTLADIIAANWADVASDEYGDDVMGSADAWRDMVGWMRDAHSGVKIMACAKDMIGGECPAGEIFRASDGFPRIKPRTGVVDCADCGEHIMSDDMSIPATCEGGCTVENVNGPWIDPVCGCERWADPSEVPCPDHTVTAPVEDMEAPTLTTYEVRLSVEVDGIKINLGWHTFTVADVTMIPDAYGAANGEWSRPGTPDWASIITVDECYAE